uniref:Phospholipid transfer protein n=1 Tax=Naja naja TaxID=35670 RepID=A0A8C6Y2Z6_NAJNA
MVPFFSVCLSSLCLSIYLSSIISLSSLSFIHSAYYAAQLTWRWPSLAGLRRLPTQVPGGCLADTLRTGPTRGEPPAHTPLQRLTSCPLQERAAMPQSCLLLLLAWLGAASVAAQPPACKMRITDKGLALVKQEGLRFVEQELENISIPDLHGKQLKLHYNISNVKVTHLQLNFSELHFQPEHFLAFRINNGSIGVRFRRQLLYWFFYDVGSTKMWAEGVDIHTLLQLSRDEGGRLKIANMSCNASIAHMHTGFSGTLRKVYEFVARLITRGMRYLLSRQICPALDHAVLVLLNSLLETMPVRNPVDKYVGSDYSLLSDPHVTAESIDLDFKGMFFPLRSENEMLPNMAPEPLLRETERMVYMGLSEYFFDSALFSYYQAGVLSMEFVGDEVPADLEVLLRASFLGTLILLEPDVMDAPFALKLQVTIRPSGTSISVSARLNIFLVPPDQPLILLSSLVMESHLSAKVMLHNKAIQVHLDLRRFRIYSNQSAFETLARGPREGSRSHSLKAWTSPRRPSGATWATSPSGPTCISPMGCERSSRSSGRPQPLFWPPRLPRGPGSHPPPGSNFPCLPQSGGALRPAGCKDPLSLWDSQIKSYAAQCLPPVLREGLHGGRGLFSSPYDGPAR